MSTRALIGLFALGRVRKSIREVQRPDVEERIALTQPPEDPVPHTLLKERHVPNAGALGPNAPPRRAAGRAHYLK